MSKTKLGKLRPKYSFILNPYANTRLSKCPCCQRMTHMRKFVLFIFIKKWGPLALGKTCRYCTPCELIIAHKNELEDELVGVFERHAPDVIGNPYIVMGTVEKQHWKQSLGRHAEPLTDALNHVCDFKKVLDLKMEGGWQPMNMHRPTKKI